jgi:membrane associated rhomboid family serine protease
MQPGHETTSEEAPMRRTSGAMLCPNCRKLISVDEPRCPFCGTQRPGLWGFGPALQQILGPNLDVVTIVFGACIALYVISLLLDLRAALQSHGLFGILSPSNLVLYRLGMTGGVPLQSRWWTLWTAIYLHGGLLHIGFNMWWLRSLGPEAQRIWGPVRFFILWSITGAVGFVLSNLFGGGFSLGASGSILGIAGALVVFGRRHGTALAAMASRQLLISVIFIFVIGFVIRGVDNYAHLGGFLSGMALARVLPDAHRHTKRSEQLLALGFVVLTLVGFVLSWVDPLGQVR